MSDELAFVAGRIANYTGYADEMDRHDTDMRVRAYVGEALTGAQTRLGATMTAATNAALEAVLYRCMFTDQVFIRKFEHAELDAATIAALVHSDLLLIGYGDEAKNVAAEDLPALLHAIDAQFDYRRSPMPRI
jgi:hypothetical protein